MAGFSYDAVMYTMTREEAGLFWKAIQRERGRITTQIAVAARVGNHGDKSTFKRYITGMTTGLAKLLDPEEIEEESIRAQSEAFMRSIGGVRVKRNG